MAEETDEKAESKGGGIIVPLIVLTLLAGGAGFGLGAFVLAESMKKKPQVAAKKAGDDVPAKLKKKKAGKDKKKGKYAKKEPKQDKTEPAEPAKKKTLRLVAIPAIITNLKEPNGSWIRIESKAVANTYSIENEAALTQRLSQDILMYLRTLRIADIDSSNGLLQVRTDLNDIARIRSKGTLDEIVIQGLIVE